MKTHSVRLSSATGYCPTWVYRSPSYYTLPASSRSAARVSRPRGESTEGNRVLDAGIPHFVTRARWNAELPRPHVCFPIMALGTLLWLGAFTLAVIVWLLN